MASCFLSLYGCIYRCYGTSLNQPQPILSFLKLKKKPSSRHQKTSIKLNVLKIFHVRKFTDCYQELTLETPSVNVT